MFVGHLAVSLGAKAVEPRIPLSVLVAASFGLDLLWPVLLLAGVEAVRIAPGDTAFAPLEFVSYPVSHSLLTVLAFGAGAALLAHRGLNDARAAWIVGGVLVSHWVLDAVAHRADLPLWPAGPRVGLGLWNSIPATLLVEGALFAGAVAAYAHAQRPLDAVGRWSFRALIALTGTIWISQPWSPPPPSATAVAIVGLTTWLFPPWASWIDRHHAPARPTPAVSNRRGVPDHGHEMR